MARYLSAPCRTAHSVVTIQTNGIHALSMLGIIERFGVSRPPRDPPAVKTSNDHIRIGRRLNLWVVEGLKVAIAREERSARLVVFRHLLERERTGLRGRYRRQEPRVLLRASH
jgi:hypothetical protein